MKYLVRRSSNHRKKKTQLIELGARNSTQLYPKIHQDLPLNIEAANFGD